MGGVRGFGGFFWEGDGGESWDGMDGWDGEYVRRWVYCVSLTESYMKVMCVAMLGTACIIIIIILINMSAGDGGI